LVIDIRLQRVALGLEYAGDTFWGWQRQPSGPTVQASVEAAMSAIGGMSIVVSAAGRTDTGVHATGQVIHADVPADRPISAWVRGVNSHLPDTVTVNWAVPVSTEFHARFRATGRAYRYLLLNRATRPGIEHGRVGWHHRPLSVEQMRRAAVALIGRHDFTSFRAAECQARTPVRDLRALAISRRGEYLVIDFEADAFLHHMVRNLVGSLVAVGNGSRPPEWIVEVLGARDRRQAAPTFAPDGLYLSAVTYDAHWGLPNGASFPDRGQ
jgi:tRNA pseudouridine38-40 synthase